MTHESDLKQVLKKKLDLGSLIESNRFAVDPEWAEDASGYLQHQLD